MADFKTKLVNDENVFNVLCDLFFRWEDEWRYEDFADYSRAIKIAVTNSIGEIGNAVCRDEPFGIDFDKDGARYGLDFVLEGDMAKLVIHKAA
jgi:hypothetical protein